MRPDEELPGLDRLMEVCRRLNLRLETTPPSHSPLQAGFLIEGLPFDPVLAALYSRLGFAAFATDVGGIVLHPLEDNDRQLEEQNRWWSEGYRQQLALPTLVFAGEPHLAYHYATVPALADEQGRQPVVWVDVYEEKYALPVASNVDLFFEAYSRYLEALMVIPNAREEHGALLAFPWEVPNIMSRDSNLVADIRAGHFDVLMPGTEERAWARKVSAAGSPRVRMLPRA